MPHAAPTSRQDRPSNSARAARRSRPFDGAVLVLVALLSWCVPARAAFEASDESWEGWSEFYSLAQARLGKARVLLSATLDYSQLRPQDALLIAHPDVQLDPDRLSEFLQAGGRVALLDDFGRSDDFLAQFGIRRIGAPRQPAISLRDDPHLAVALPATEPGSEAARHPIVANVDHVITNHPRALQHPALTEVLVMPAAGGEEAPLAVTGVIAQRGRLFVMSDPSVFINLMLRYPGNRALAAGLVDYLTEQRGEGAPGRLTILVNDFEQRGGYGGQDGIHSQLRDLADRLQAETARWRRDGLPDLLLLLLAAAALTPLAFWAFGIGVRAYRPAVPRFAANPPLVAQGGVAGRAAMLAAPTTDRGLVALELKAALVSALHQRTGLGESEALSRVVEVVRSQGVLGPSSFRDLKQMLEGMRRVEDRLAGAHATRVSVAQLERWRQLVLRLLGETGSKD